MCKLIINDDNDNLKSYNLKNYEIIITNDELRLTLITDKQTINYGIRADMREGELTSIKDFISELLQESYSKGKPFKISEYLQRMYIFIGDENNCRQFTANRK